MQNHQFNNFDKQLNQALCRAFNINNLPDPFGYDKKNWLVKNKPYEQNNSTKDKSIN